mmetsp:Transcript_8325/g.17820  ORF Transcript_8325/g.17820 Transcript_8325/m.17820 type:complete len:298 (-) Transcript_8325:969-1862(-)
MSSDLANFLRVLVPLSPSFFLLLFLSLDLLDDRVRLLEDDFLESMLLPLPALLSLPRLLPLPRLRALPPVFLERLLRSFRRESSLLLVSPSLDVFLVRLLRSFRLLRRSSSSPPVSGDASGNPSLDDLTFFLAFLGDLVVPSPPVKGAASAKSLGALTVFLVFLAGDLGDFESLVVFLSLLLFLLRRSGATAAAAASSLCKLLDICSAGSSLDCFLMLDLCCCLLSSTTGIGSSSTRSSELVGSVSSVLSVADKLGFFLAAAAASLASSLARCSCSFLASSSRTRCSCCSRTRCCAI